MYRRAFLIDPLLDVRIAGASMPGKSVFFSIVDEFADFYDYYYQAFDDIDQGHYDQAYGRLQRLINDMNGDSHADRIPGVVLFWHGIAAAHIAKYDDAIRDFTQLLGRSTKEEKKDSLMVVPLRTNEYRYMLAVLNHRAGKLEKAVALYRETLENDVGLYAAHSRLAEIADSNNNIDAAIQERRAAVNANPDDSGLLLSLGITLGEAGDLGDSEQTLRQAMEINPRDSRACYYLGVVEQRLGKTDAARATFTTFVGLAPSRYDRQIQDAKRFLAHR